MSLFSKFFQKVKPKNPEDAYTITITENLIKVEHPQRATEQVIWENIQEIKIISTDSGPSLPDIWLALLGAKDGCLVPHGTKGFDEIYEIVSNYYGFNSDNFIKAMSCTNNAEFNLWTKT